MAVDVDQIEQKSPLDHEAEQFTNKSIRIITSSEHSHSNNDVEKDRK